eukprot:Hpha_TRINITY_DN6004_c0_g1::TRINITY_DN6004_c0_g1_i1::g.63358::m.63358
MAWWLVVLAAAQPSRLVCRPKASATDAELSSALGTACGQIDCAPIQSSGACFTGGNLRSFCDYAFWKYYDAKKSVGGTCDFGGTAELADCFSDNATECTPCPDPQCSAHAICNSTGQTGNCCPNDQGNMAHCCKSEPTASPTGAPTSYPSPPPPPLQQGLRTFLEGSTIVSGGRTMPLSFQPPTNYFADIPLGQRPSSNRDGNKTAFVDVCGETVSAANLDAYEFQTETLLTEHGLNVYDSAMWCVALAVVGNTELPLRYLNDILLPQRTAGMTDIRADDPCGGIVPPLGTCTSNCGWCYGDTTASQSQRGDSGFFFRSVGQDPSPAGNPDARCPSKNVNWAWNDWKPVLGENAWAALLGPLTVAYKQQGYWGIHEFHPGIRLARAVLPALVAMRVGTDPASSFGQPVYYAPHNAQVGGNPDSGRSVSTENQASLLAGLKAFRWLLSNRTDWDWRDATLADVEGLIEGITNYLIAAYDPSLGYFRQGGSYNPNTQAFSWVQNTGIPSFAVDCQTWVGTVLGPELIEARLGGGSNMRLWTKTKDLGGYVKNGVVVGVGYTEVSSKDVFSGEWTLGAVNWMRTLAASPALTDTERASASSDAAVMQAAVQSELTMHSLNGLSILYANRRYYIPFGWYSNPIPSLCSTAWLLALQNDHNPFMLTGNFSADYPHPPENPHESSGFNSVIIWGPLVGGLVLLIVVVLIVMAKTSDKGHEPIDTGAVHKPIIQAK